MITSLSEEEEKKKDNGISIFCDNLDLVPLK